MQGQMEDKQNDLQHCLTICLKRSVFFAPFSVLFITGSKNEVRQGCPIDDGGI